MRFLLTLALALTFTACQETPADETGAEDYSLQETGDQKLDFANYETYGDDREVIPQEAMPVADVAREADNWSGETVTVSGTIQQVCQQQGCWLTLDPGPDAEPIRITMPRTAEGEYVYTVPTDIAGREAIVRGTLDATEMSEEERQHYQDDARAAGDADAEMPPAREVRIIADAVLVASV